MFSLVDYLEKLSSQPDRSYSITRATKMTARCCLLPTFRGIWLICLLACLSSFAVLFFSLQRIERPRRRYATVTSHEDQSHDLVQDLIRQNRELKLTVERLRSSSDDIHRPEHRLSSRRTTWQERGLKNVQNNLITQSEHRPILLAQNQGLDCQDISRITIGRELGRGYTKVTQLGVYDGTEVAVKSAALDSVDVQKCVEKKRVKHTKDCLLFSRYKIMKELLLYQQLRHPNIVMVLGYCMQNDYDTGDIKKRGLTVVTELGIPVDMMMLLQMPWHQRFRISVGLSRLLHFLSDSPLGSLVIHDFQFTQFVLVDGEIKISDLDDVSNEPHLCDTSDDCRIGNEYFNITLPCVRRECQRFNEKWNIYNLYRFYLKTFLLPGAPQHLHRELENVLTETASLRFDNKYLLGGLHGILTKLRNGTGLNTTINNEINYKMIPEADFPGRHDFICPQSWSSVNCQLVVFNENEAKEKCNEESQCKAFVMNYDKTWIGYKFVYLKNNASQVVYSADSVVYVKIT